MSGYFEVPSFPKAFFQWYCKKELYEELHGDLEEFFYERVEARSLRFAQWMYWLDVIKCCQPYAWKDLESQNSDIIMFKNYFKTSFRSMMRHPLSTMINLLGLSTAIGICVLAYAFNQYKNKVDQFHENRNNVYLSTFFADRDGKEQQNGKSPLPLASLVQQDFASVKTTARLQNRAVVVKSGSNVFHERISFVDPDFLQMMTFPLKWGNAHELNDPNSIILSSSLSEKYFGKQVPLGEMMLVIIGKDQKKLFKVVGVAEEFPGARSFSFKALVHFDNLTDLDQGLDTQDWNQLIDATFIQLDEPQQHEYIASSMDKYADQFNKSSADWKINRFSLQPLSSLYRNSGSISGDIASNEYHVLQNSAISFVIIGLFVLILGSTNYINIAIVSASKRLKEIGLRKAIGANRRMIVIQFLLENICIMTIAMFVGLLLGTTLFIQWMEQTMNFKMDFTLNDPYLFLFLLVVLLFTSLLSGVYPALYIARFQTASIFSGKFKIGSKSILTRVFLGFQLSLGCILVSIAVLFTQNTIYQSQRSWGYDIDRLVYVKFENAKDLRKMRNVFVSHKDIEALADSRHHIGKEHEMIEVDMPDRNYEVQLVKVGDNYLETMQFPIDRRGPLALGKNGDIKGIMVNQTFVDHLDLKQPIGHAIKYGGGNYHITGVLKDFHSYNFYTKIKPLIIQPGLEDESVYLTLRTSPGTTADIKNELEATWATLFPEIPFNGGFQNTVWGNYYENIKDGDRFWRALASIVMLIAGLGLYGLVALNVSGRNKEFSIRKVLGAEWGSVARAIGKQYTLVFVVALSLGAPISYFLTRMIFDLFFPYHMPMNFHFFGYSLVIMLLVLLAILSSQVRRVSRNNPVVGLRSE